MQTIPLFLCCLFGLLLLAGYGVMYYRAWQQMSGSGPNLLGLAIKELRRVTPSIAFWTPLGAVFGLIGVMLLMGAVGIPLEEATVWLILGVVTGALWGVVWGIVFGLTEK